MAFVVFCIIKLSNECGCDESTTSSHNYILVKKKKTLVFVIKNSSLDCHVSSGL
jgi:hypothetical protein